MPRGKEYRAHLHCSIMIGIEAPMFHLALDGALFKLTYKAPHRRPLSRLQPNMAKARSISLYKLTTHVYSYFYYEETAFPPFLLCRKFPLPCRKLFVGRRSPEAPPSVRRSAVQVDSQSAAPATGIEVATEHGEGRNFIVIPQPITVVC